MIIKLVVALFLGFFAGILDVFPMIRKNFPKASIMLIFSQWVFISLILPFIDLGLLPWMTGVIVALVGMAPICILAYYRNKSAIISILIYAFILGAGLAIGQDLLLRLLTD